MSDFAKDTNVPDDTISRRSAIGLVEGIETMRMKGEIDLTYPKLIKGLMALPPAHVNATNLQPNCNQIATDCISRRDAVSRFSDLLMLELEGKRLPTWEEVYNAMQDVPPSQPERKTGKWQETDDGWDGVYYVCSECGCSWTLIDGTPSDNGMNFCPHCGCAMEGVEQ